MRALLLLAIGLPLFGATNSLTIYEADGGAQNDRITTFGRVFEKGEIATCAQPIIGGSALDTSHYQVDVKNRYDDDSLKYAVITIKHSLTSGGNNVVTFQNTADCNNTGSLDQAGMDAFNESTPGAKDGWGARLEATANSATQLVDAKAMLAALTFADCKLEYFLQGPLVTQVVVQDCTATKAYDFGANWNGTTMQMDTGPVWYTGTNQYASLHPIFVLTFYPATNVVSVDFILEDPWNTSLQDQKYSVVLKTGSPLATKWTSSVFLHQHASRWRKKFYSGTGPGHIRINHNFAYLMQTKAIPNYDTSLAPSPDTNYGVNMPSRYSDFIAGDKGDITTVLGHALLDTDTSSNDEGAPVNFHDLMLLYNMGSCGTSSGLCAKAAYILTGERGDADGGLAANVPGGGGMWQAISHFGNVHYREGRTTAGKYYYCPSFDGKDVLNTATCTGGTVPAVGHRLSRHSRLVFQPPNYPTYPTVGYVGTRQLTGWSVDTSHIQDYSYMAYLLTGEWFFLDEQQYWAAAGHIYHGDSGTNNYGNNKFFAYSNDTGAASLLRGWVWPMVTNGHAAFISPDGSAEQLLNLSMMDSNLEVKEGLMNVTGTTLTPTTPNTTCASHNPDASNRWDWGHCTVSRGIGLTLHEMIPSLTSNSCYTYGRCSSASVGTGENWHHWYAAAGLGHLNELGFTQALPLAKEAYYRLIEEVKDPTYNPYLVGLYIPPGHNADGTEFTTWAEARAALAPAYRDMTTFDSFTCDNHNYEMVAHAAGSYAKDYNSGGYSGADAWTWLDANVVHGAGCAVNGIQMKWAMEPRTAVVTLDVSPATLTFAGNEGGSNPAAQTITVGATGTTLDDWSATKTQSWLTLTPASGAAAGTFDASVSLAGLTGGTYTDTITVTSTTAGITNSPQTIGVSFEVTGVDAPTIDTASIPSSVVWGKIYPTTTLAASGGTGPYTWSFDNATTCMPSGLSLSLGGVISGRAGLTQNCTIVVIATDSLDVPSIGKSYSISVAYPTPPAQTYGSYTLAH